MSRSICGQRLREIERILIEKNIKRNLTSPIIIRVLNRIFMKCSLNWFTNYRCLPFTHSHTHTRHSTNCVLLLSSSLCRFEIVDPVKKKLYSKWQCTGKYKANKLLVSIVNQFTTKWQRQSSNQCDNMNIGVVRWLALFA